MNKNIIESENVDAASLAQLRLNYERKQAEQRKNDFDYAETQLYLSQQQNLEDCYLIQEKIAEWMDGIKAKKPEKFKDDPNYKMFSNFINAIFRIENYTRNIETSNKKAIVEYLEQKRETEKYIGLYNQERLQGIHNSASAERKIKSLESEIQFINKNSK